ncbi:Uma2 family endonuclease [Thermomonospora cellulosilytica]|uniref:Uma2 family endonuclease n=1 Tax=Thermomonospora cellulosilytica TaxID=1411118 RepID=A0A7W3MWP5_9ACTN|nr:Uma2 family endonuclease [Thermomonospora cellulosilytica]MBA9003290.1 Uma2 family endonuclease [Thermomonospora cellulosilytica]
MTAAPFEPPVREDLRQALAAIEVLPGMRAELIDGEIIVSPTPDGEHETIVVAVDDWVREHGLRLHRNLTLISPEGEYVPDGVAAPKGTFADRDWHSKPDGVVLVLEVTSREKAKGDKDRGPKRRGYAAADIPLYLLIDRYERKATIFSDPRGGDYHHSTSVMLGDELQIPEPLEGILDTAELTSY